ncbi:MULTISPECIES: squalene/phytoene synthase family protein [unclassified Actinotalea]|uniref:phytoene/squalene synthase family protein n=1 Tax=unclassified Actinotalea TaxID=2638618 RepID=UPI0015F65014|nr:MULTISPECIES: squalene/phytoene synthase family protein [unclassified Actinotalea]
MQHRPTDRLSLYDTVAERAAGVVVREYSTSFGLATRLLSEPARTRIRTVYALVRLADEVVDGAATQAGAAGVAQALLDDLEAETDRAVARGYSTNVLVHAFARTAAEAGIGTELTRPFFASMRTDLHRTVHDADSLRDYVYGSAEVVGLMCLRVFLLDLPEPGRERAYARLTPGARALGAAFQKINFLRDLADDSERLGRRYFVDVDPASLTEAQKAAILADIHADLRLAAQALPGLPPSARRAVALAYGLFAELTRRLERTPAVRISHTRVRVPATVKARVAAGALLPVAR